MSLLYIIIIGPDTQKWPQKKRIGDCVRIEADEEKTMFNFFFCDGETTSNVVLCVLLKGGVQAEQCLTQ